MDVENEDNPQKRYDEVIALGKQDRLPEEFWLKDLEQQRGFWDGERKECIPSNHVYLRAVYTYRRFTGLDPSRLGLFFANKSPRYTAPEWSFYDGADLIDLSSLRSWLQGYKLHLGLPIEPTLHSILNLSSSTDIKSMVFSFHCFLAWKLSNTRPWLWNFTRGHRKRPGRTVRCAKFSHISELHTGVVCAHNCMNQAYYTVALQAQWLYLI